jgi:hypothetical protein
VLIYNEGKLRVLIKLKIGGNMIIETKRWQAVVFILGMASLFFSVGALLNFGDIYCNICLKKGSQFFYYLNQSVLFIGILLIGVAGAAFLYAVFYSIKKCHEFRQYETKRINYKKIGWIVFGNVVIIASLIAFILLWNKVVNKTINDNRKELPSTLSPLTQTIVILKMKVLSYVPKDKYTKGPEWENVEGISRGVIESPQKYKGLSIKVKVLSSGEILEEKLKKIGGTVSFRIILEDHTRKLVRKDIDIRDVLSSNSYLTSSRLLFMK